MRTRVSIVVGLDTGRKAGDQVYVHVTASTVVCTKDVSQARELGSWTLENGNATLDPLMQSLERTQ